jgi:hypothetical protein
MASRTSFCIGETAIPPVRLAIGNAISRAVGYHFRFADHRKNLARIGE